MAALQVPPVPQTPPGGGGLIPGLVQKDSTASLSGAFLGVSILHPCHSQGVPVTLVTSILSPLSPMVILVLPTPGPSLLCLLGTGGLSFLQGHYMLC